MGESELPEVTGSSRGCGPGVASGRLLNSQAGALGCEVMVKRTLIHTAFGNWVEGWY